MQKLPGHRALPPSSDLTKTNTPHPSVWPPSLLSQTQCLWLWVVCSEMWQTSHFRKTTSDRLLCVMFSNRTAGRPRHGYNPSKLLTESLSSWNKCLPPNWLAPASPAIPIGKWSLLLFYAERTQVTFQREAVNTWHFLILFVFYHFSIVVFTILFSFWDFFCNAFVQLIPSCQHIWSSVSWSCQYS